MLLLSWLSTLLLWSATVSFRPSAGCRVGPKGDAGPQGVRGDPGRDGERGPPGPHVEAGALLDMEKRLVRMEVMLEREREEEEKRDRERDERLEAVTRAHQEVISKQDDLFHRHESQFKEVGARIADLNRTDQDRSERVERLSAELDAHRVGAGEEAQILRDRIARQTKLGVDLERGLSELAEECSLRSDHLTAGIGLLNETLARVVTDQAEIDDLHRQHLERQDARIRVQEESLAGAIREREGLEEELEQQAAVIGDQDTRLMRQSVAIGNLSARVERCEQLAEKLRDSTESQSVAISDLKTDVHQSLESVRRLEEEMEQRQRKDEDQDERMDAADALTSGFEVQIEKHESNFRLLLFHLDFHEDCSAIKQAHPDSPDGAYRIFPLNGSLESAEVWCDMTTEGGGWTVLQRRVDGSLDFNKNFSEYVTGFGNPGYELWLGLDWQHLLTTSKPVELRIDLRKRNGESYYAKYNKFTIGEGDLYRLNFDEYSGDAGEGLHIDMSWHQGQVFSAMGRDLTDKDCVKRFKGGWWFGYCFMSNLNGGNYHSDDYREGMFWWSLNNQQSLAFSRMMIRAK